MNAGDRILTVSMVSDTLPNVEAWVDRTLATGVDHMLVFLDDDRPDVLEMLRQHPFVTPVHTDDEYWHGDRPVPLPDRQMVNANLSLRALTEVPSAGWLFHIDVDEALSFDREAFLELSPRAARFPTLEAVARREWDGMPTWLKRRPTREELHALAGLGVIRAPEIDTYFRGHHQGKAGVRPERDIRFRVHSVYELPDEPVELVEPPDMYLLHYASYSVDDFVARWEGFRPDQAAGRPFRSEHLGTAFHTLWHHPALDAAGRRRMVAELFDRQIADDEATLRDFGLLVEDPRHRAEPRPLPGDEVRHLEAVLAGLHAEDKTPFRSRLLQLGRRTAGSR